MSLWKMSGGQLKRYALDEVERMADDSDLAGWEPECATCVRKAALVELVEG